MGDAYRAGARIGPEGVRYGGMRTHSRDQARTAGVGSVKRPSPRFGAEGETRRNGQFRELDRTRRFDLIGVIVIRAQSPTTMVGLAGLSPP